MNHLPVRSWTSRALEAVAILLAVAYGGRLAWDLLQPLVGWLITAGVLLVVISLVIRRRSWW